MTVQEKNAIVDRIIQEIQNMPDGSKATTIMLMGRCGIDTSGMDKDYFYDLFRIHDALFKKTKHCGIYLDMSAHNGLEEGLPFNLDFIIRKRKPGKKCPRCGNTNTGKILYGMPHYTEELERQERLHEIYIGGCCITGHDPRYHCFNCQKNFGADPIIYSKYGNGKLGLEDYRDIINEISFKDGGFTSGHINVDMMKRTLDDITVDISSNISCDHMHRKMTADEWKNVIDGLYCKAYLHEWKHNFTNPDVLDGEQWSLDIALTHKRHRHYYGSNSFPPYWDELKQLFQPFINELGLG